MEAFFGALAAVSPLLAETVRWLLVVLAALLVWLVVSVPAAIVHAGLNAALAHAAAQCSRAASRLFGLAAQCWARSRALGDEAVRSLSVRYVYDRAEARLLAVLRGMRNDTAALGERLESSAAALAQALGPLQRELELVADTAAGGRAPQLPQLEELRAASASRRTATLMLAVFLLLLAALVTVNTSLLTRFFESFFEEYISYDWGLKWATVVALMFSLLELALGVSMFYVGRQVERDSLLAPLAKTVVVLMVLALAFIESYLYLLLSADLARQSRDMLAELPALQSLRHWWLAPFGFVIVVGLSFVGHALMDGLNRFADASHLKDLRRALEDFRRSLARADSGWESLRSRLEGGRGLLTEFGERLAGAGGALGELRSTRERLRETVEALLAARREPVSATSPVEAAAAFAALKLQAALGAIAFVALCALAVQGLQATGSLATLAWPLGIGLALLQAGALLVAGYKAYPPVTSALEGAGDAVLRSTRESLTGLACLGVAVASLALGYALVPHGDAVLRQALLAIMAVAAGAFFLLGRSLPGVALAATTLARQAASLSAAALTALAGLGLGIAFVALRALAGLVHAAAYPALGRFARGAPLASKSP